MLSFPNRCQYLKVNGTQCGSPALRRNRFCFFHKRHHEERIQLHADRARRARRATIDLPALEDANSVQVSLMQILRLTLAGQIDNKTAGLALYALQIASSNLSRTTFTPFRHDVVLDPRTVDQTALDEYIWQDEDFEEEEDEDTMRAEALAEVQRKAAKQAEIDQWAREEADRITIAGAQRRAAEEKAQAAHAARIAAITAKIEADRAAGLAAEREAKPGAKQLPPASSATALQPTSPTAPAATITPTGHAVVAPTSVTENPGRRPPANVNIKEVREQIRDQIRKELPAFAAVLAEKNRNTSG